MSRFARIAPVALLAALAVTVPAVPARAGNNDGVVPAANAKQSSNSAARIDEQIGAQVPMDLVLRDENDQPVALGACVGDKPTILVPVYYRCPMLCTQVLNGLLKATREMPPSFSIGRQFNVVAVSMDPKEHGSLARQNKEKFVGEYGRPGAEGGCRFLTGTKEATKALLDTIGFRYEFDKMLKEYDHPSGIVILSPKGVVTRYFHGIGYDGEFEMAENWKWTGGQPPPALTEAETKARREGREFTRPTTTLRLSLIEAADGQGASLFEKFTMFCYRYDALHQGYRLDILRAVQVGGVLTLLLVGAGVLFALGREGVLGAFLYDAAPYMLALVILPFLGMTTFVTLKPDVALVQLPRLLVPYYAVACTALFFWNRSRSRARAAAAAADPTHTQPPEGTTV